MVRVSGDFPGSKVAFAGPSLLAGLTVLLLSAMLLAPLAAQDASSSDARKSPCLEHSAASPGALPPPSAGVSPAESPATSHKPQPGQTARAAGDSLPTGPVANPDGSAASANSPEDCASPAALDVSGHSSASLSAYSSSYFSSAALARASSPQNAEVSALTSTPHQAPVSVRTGKWGGEEWRPAILQTLGFTLAQNGYRLATEQKTREALTKETWHSYYLAVSGLHTWSDGGKTWTVYVAHPAQGAVFNDIWTEHDPHGVLVPFGFTHAYWGSRIKAFWWDAAWEMQWKFGPFSEASIGNVGLKPGKLGANTIVSSAFIGTGLAVGEDMLDRYAIAKWEKHTNNIYVRAALRTLLNPDRGFANLFRARAPWYRDTRHRLTDLAPESPTVAAIGRTLIASNVATRRAVKNV